MDFFAELIIKQTINLNWAKDIKVEFKKNVLYILKII